MPRIQIHVIESVDGRSGAAHVLDRLKNIKHEPDDELWMLLDVDHYSQGEHLRTFLRTLQDARKLQINVALSKPCFELWLLLHHEEEEATIATLSNAAEVADALSRKLGQYNKTKLRQEHYPLASVCHAYKTAEQLDKIVGGGEIPEGNTTRVYQLWRSIVGGAQRSQLPKEIWDLVQE
jgi:RloB-like protein